MTELATSAIESRVVFENGAKSFTVRDLIDAAHFRGEIAEPWRRFLRLIAAESKADEAGQEADDDAIASAAEQFRYQHDLITAEETERWLGERGIDLGHFSSYFVRQFWSTTVEDDEATEDQNFESGSEELRTLFAIELTLAGDLDAMASRSSWHVAARAAAEAVDSEQIAVAKARFRKRHNLNEETEGDWLGKLGRDPEWLRAQLEMEEAYEQACARLLTPEARGREISALRLPLTRFEVETIELDSLDAAREGLLCVREDGMSMEEVANEGRYPYRHTEILLEDVPEDLQQKFLSVTPGDVLEPIAHGESFHLCRIIGKAEPHLDDSLVKSRAEDRVLERHFDELISRHVFWKNVLA
jgi:hypothetical protein